MGNQLTQSATRTLPGGGIETITSSTEYDDLGRAVLSIDALGNVTETLYNEIGQVAKTIDALGRETTFAYDDQGPPDPRHPSRRPL